MKLFMIVHFGCIFFSLQKVKGGKESQNKCAASCPKDWEKVEDRCYLWPSSDLKRSWGKAEQFCNEQDGHLASITNERIQNYMQSKEHSKDSHASFWVGGTDKDHEGNWVWTDGSVWGFTNWASRPFQAPNDWYGEDCLLVYKNWVTKHNGWNDQECSDRRSFVCSRPVCSDSDTNNNKTSNRIDKVSNNNDNVSSTNNDTSSNTNNNTSSMNNNSSSIMILGQEFPLLALALFSGGLFIVTMLLVISCAAWMCLKKTGVLALEDVEENDVYGVYELGEGGERRNSTHEIVDQNFDYE